MKKEDLAQLLKPIADTFNVAVKELWGIFVRQYLIKGIAELVTTVLTALACYGAWKFGTTVSQVLSVIAGCVSVMYLYDSIQLIGNPKYYALQDLISQVKGKVE